MREAPDIDFYIEWSSVVEAPTFAGTRAEMLAHLRTQQHPADNLPEVRLARCDETGTTARWVEAAGMRDRYAEEGAWDDGGFIYEQRGTVERRDLFTLARRLLADDDADVSDLIRPFGADPAQPGGTE
jgi:hypothetical protein